LKASQLSAPLSAQPFLDAFTLGVIISQDFFKLSYNIVDLEQYFGQKLGLARKYCVVNKPKSDCEQVDQWPYRFEVKS
jgi:hypothetical protein